MLSPLLPGHTCVQDDADVGIDSVVAAVEHASPVLYELFRNHGMEPRLYVPPSPEDRVKQEAERRRPRVLSDQTKLFLQNPAGFRFSSESFAPGLKTHLVAGCCDRRANVDIAAPGAGIFNHGFIEYLQSLTASGHSVDIQTHEDCLACQKLANDIQVYHPEDMASLYGKVLAQTLGGSHSHVKLQPATEDSFVMYLDPTGRLQDATLSGLPRGFKITMSKHNVDETVRKKIEKLMGLATSIADLEAMLPILCNYHPHADLPKPCVVVVDDGSRLARRTIKCTHQTLADMYKGGSVNVVRMAAPWLSRNTDTECVKEEEHDDVRYQLA